MSWQSFILTNLTLHRIVDDAGLKWHRIDKSNATNIWHSVLIVAEKTGKVEALLDVVEGEYGNNQEFLAARDAYRQPVITVDPTELAPQEPVKPKIQSKPWRQRLSALLLGLLLLLGVAGRWYWGLKLINAGDGTPTPTSTTPTLPAPATQSIATATVAEFSPTDTVTPEDTPTSNTMPTPLVETFYFTISIAAVATNRTDGGYTDPPSGNTILGGILFNLPDGRNSVTTQAKAEAFKSNPTEIRLTNFGIKSPRSVHLLITGGSTSLAFKNKKVGEIHLIFSDNQSQSVDLIPGVNLREWKTYGDHNVTTTSAPNIAQVWTGENNFDSSLAIIDMLTINIPSNYQNSTLVAIEIYDTSEQTVGDLNPAINLIGVTVFGIQ